MWPVIFGLASAGLAGAGAAMAENRVKRHLRDRRIIEEMIAETPRFSDLVTRRLDSATLRVERLNAMGMARQAVNTMIQELREILEQDRKVPMLSQRELRELTELHDDLVGQA